jgi:putative glycosyltransferase (TIGR04348 family)
MKVLIVTPAPPRSRKGNRVTAERWRRLLRQLGHRVTIEQRYTDRPCDVLVALHAVRSAASAARFRAEHPEKPLVVALTGTDLYEGIHRCAAGRRSLELADRLVVLQERAVAALPRPVQAKARAIYQSVPAPRTRLEPLHRVFQVSVLAHLRSVKDPLCAARAARRLPRTSRIRIVLLGAALDATLGRRARAEAESNPRFRWLGEKPHWQAMRRLARSRLLAVTSKLEGGANVVSEALAHGVPVVSSRIDGSLGILGDDYPGYFPVGDSRALADLLLRCETNRAFYRTLQSHCQRLKPLVDPARERRSWKELLDELLA